MLQAMRSREEGFFSEESNFESGQGGRRDLPRTKTAETLQESLTDLAELVANFTEAHTAAIFLTQPDGEHLKVAGHHTLSREFLPEAEIPFGAGLVGWTAENAVRISVCPFEHDATTLLYYRSHEPLKSFIAVPILSPERELLGVIACDSMKSYAFPKITEKLLFNCTQQAASLIALYGQLEEIKGRTTTTPLGLDNFIEALRSFDAERALFTAACELPETIVNRDALVILSVAEGGVGEGEFYSAANQSRAGNRLLDIVCQHKKIICSDRVVVAPPSEDSFERSFLSVPFKVMGREAGSFNLLSEPRASFQASQIAAVEKIASVLGRELERIRLRERVTTTVETSSNLSWNSFALHVKTLLSRAEPEGASYSLVRISLQNLQEIEQRYGSKTVTSSLHLLTRLIDQVKRGPAPVCQMYGGEFLLFTESTEARRTVQRLSNLLTKQFAGARVGGDAELGALLLQGMVVSLAVFPQDGTTLEELSAKTLELITTPPKSEEPTHQAPAKEERARGWGFFSR